MVATGQPPTTPQPAPSPPQRSGPWFALLIGCLILFLGILIAGAGIGLAIWKPWETEDDDRRPPIAEIGDTDLTDDATDELDDQPAVITQEETPEETAAAGPAFITINAASTSATGAAFKLFAEDGTTLDSGVIPASVAVQSDSRCKLVVSKTGYKPWDDWQAIGAPGSSHDVSVLLEKQPPNTVTVSVCTSTGRKANQWCPATTKQDFAKGKEPSTCTLHKAPPGRVSIKVCTVSGRRATQWCPTAVTQVFDQNRVPGYCTTHRAAQATVTATICTATGQRANQWCPSTSARRVPAGAVPGVCTVHKLPPPPPSQPTITIRACTASGQRAGKYCPDTTQRTIPKAQAPGQCALHAAPPPKPPTSVQQYKWCPQCNARNRVNARVCKQCRYRF